METKINLYAIGNEGKFNFYIFDKKQNVVEQLSKIVPKILNLSWDVYEADTKKLKYKKINFEKYKDFHESLTSVGSKTRLDVFYGNKRIFMTLNCIQSLRLRFNEELFKIGKMIKPINKKNGKEKK